MKKLLWIDDDERLIDASSPVFLKNGFHIVKATNTSQALSTLRKEALDGILLDVRLHGGENGLELLQEIRHLYPTLKIAIFTGYPEYDEHIQAIEEGASAYLTKIRKSFPLNPDKQQKFFQALERVFSGTSVSKSALTSVKTSQFPTSLWSSGLFFLLLFAVVIVGVGLLSNYVSPWILPIVLIAAILLVVVVGAFVLRTQGENGLNQKNFLTITLEALHLVPLLRKKPDASEGEIKSAKGEAPKSD